MKNCQEWLLEFDRAFDNISSHKAPGLVPYEKSLFLTDAQDVIWVGLYNGSLGDAFEATESVSNYLAPLVKQVILTQEVNTTDETRRIAGNNSHIFAMPSDFQFRTYEECKLNVSENCQNQDAIVVPVTQDDFWHTNRDPFKRANEHRVLRLVYATSSEKQDALTVQHYTELVSKYNIAQYLVRYIRRPNPIILEDLHNGLSIHGETKAMTCELDEALHPLILAQAVKMAREAWGN